MTHKGGKYIQLKERWDAGDRSTLVLPYDMLLLEMLQAEGTTAGGVYPIGTTVVEIVKRIPEVPTQAATGRLKALEAVGLVMNVRMVASKGTLAWQRTKAGEEELARWKESQKSTT